MEKITLSLPQLKHLLDQQKERVAASLWMSHWSATHSNPPQELQKEAWMKDASRVDYPNDVLVIEKYSA